MPDTPTTYDAYTPKLTRSMSCIGESPGSRPKVMGLAAALMKYAKDEKKRRALEISEARMKREAQEKEVKEAQL